MDWKALTFFSKLKSLEIAKYGTNVICAFSKNYTFSENLEGVAQKLSMPCPFQM